MSSLLTSGIVGELTGVLLDHFDTFQRNIVVHKEPLKVVSSINTNNSYAGYGESSNQVNFTYVPQSRTFSAMIIYGSQQSQIISPVGSFPMGTIKIKVKEDASKYINENKTEKIEVDGKSFNTITVDRIQSYLGLKFYIYNLAQTS